MEMTNGGYEGARFLAGRAMLDEGGYEGARFLAGRARSNIDGIKVNVARGGG